MTCKRDKSSGAAFSLIEMLVAIALMAMLLGALLSFVFSMTEIWGGSGENRLFDQHVNAATQHIESMLRRSALPSSGLTQAEPFTIQEIRSPNYGTITGLVFELNDGDRLLNWGNTPAPLLSCTMGQVSDQGLVIFWRSSLEEDEDTIHETPVSPLITDLSYNYYDHDNGSWRNERQLRRGTENRWLVPEQIVLQFTYGKLQTSRTITLPITTGGIPVF